MTTISTRDSMIAWMEAEGSARITEYPTKNWRRLNTVIADQSSGHIDGEIKDFHLFEVTYQGALTAKVQSELEQGDFLEVSLVPGMVQYTQPDTQVIVDMRGEVSLQQIYIDHSIFQEVAQATRVGDPDRLKTLGIHGVFDPAMKNVAAAILDEARRPSAGGELYADLLAQQIALLILRRQHDLQNLPEQSLSLSQTELTRVIDHLQSDLSETGGIDTLATLLDMDPFTFTRAFKARTGQAPHQFLIQLRLNKIKDLLINTDNTLADIAYETGFSSQSHMTAMFSGAVGVPPGRYRRDARPAKVANARSR